MSIGSRGHTQLGFIKGNQNTDFFHAQASERRRRNKIEKLKEDGGGEVAGKHLKAFIANQYQKRFFSTVGTHVEEVLVCV
jgi:hypothetical protein